MEEENDAKRPVSRRWWLIPVTLFGLGASILVVQQVIFQIQYGGMPIAAWTRGFAPDCSWDSTAVSWIDGNANGLYDKGEQPLPGVTFHVDDILNDNADVGWRPSLSNWKGETNLAVRLPGCPRAKFEIYPDIPSGYRLTTRPRVSVDVTEFGKMLDFGFGYLPGTPTATPRPPTPVCTSYQIGLANQYDLTDLAVAADGTVWAATYNNGVAHYLPNQDKWVRYTTIDGLVDNRVRSITPTDNGAVWFAADGGASMWDGSKWIAYTVGSGLINNNVYKIAKSPDGSVWFATQGGVSHLIPGTGSWTSYTTKDGLAEDFVMYIAITPDGSVWLPTVTAGISRLIPPSEAGENSRWITYTANSKSITKVPIDFIRDIEVAPDDTYWFGGSGGLMSFDPRTQQWKEYDYDTTNGGFTDWVNAFTFGLDGSVWVASGSDMPVVYHFIVTQPEKSPHTWQYYDSRDGLPRVTDVNVNEDSAVAIAVASNDVVWIGTREFATRCAFE